MKNRIRNETCNQLLTVSRLEDESVLTQYLFQSISRSFLSNDDLKYETSKEQYLERFKWLRNQYINHKTYIHTSALLSALYFFLLPLLLLIKLLKRHEAQMYLIYVLRNLLFTMNSKVFNLVQWNSLVFRWPFIWWFVALIKNKNRTFFRRPVLHRAMFRVTVTETGLHSTINHGPLFCKYLHILSPQNNMD